MRRSIFAAFLAATLAVPSFADGPQTQSSLGMVAPTAPPGDNSNRLATTAFVQGAAGGSLALASGKIFVGSVGNIATAQTMSGDATMSSAGALTLATVNANVGSFGSSTQCVSVTNNAKGLTTAISAATCTPAIGSITGFGTGVAAALANTLNAASGLVGFSGALGTPTSGTLTNATGLPVATGISGLGSGIASWLATPSSANLASALTDETGTGSAVFSASPTFTGTPAAPTAAGGTNTTQIATTQFVQSAVVASTTGVASIAANTGAFTLNATSGITNSTNDIILSQASSSQFGAVKVDNVTLLATAGVIGQKATTATNSLSGNVALNNIANYFDGPSMAQGTTGTWLATGTVSVFTNVADSVWCKLWDGTTVISSASGFISGANLRTTISLSGVLATPAANIRISCRAPGSTGGSILFNDSGNSKDSTITGVRIQ